MSLCPLLKVSENVHTLIKLCIHIHFNNGPLLFLHFINDIETDIGSNIRLFADDTSLFINVENPDMKAELLNMDL